MTSALPRASRLACLVLVAGLLTTTGCTYGKDRLKDFVDVIDLKYGAGLGLGVKAEVTYYLGIGGGLGISAYNREWYGRRSYESYGDMFAHAVVFGADGGLDTQEPGPNQRTRADYHITLINMTAYADHVGSKDVMGFTDSWVVPEGYEVPPLPTRWRIGGEVLLPAFNLGIYVNLGELGDFVLGFLTIDYAEDDELGWTEGISILDTYEKGEILPVVPPGLGYGESVAIPDRDR